jgi:septum site-determining protein MinD
VIVSTNKGEPLVMAEKPSIAGNALDNIARRLEGEKVEFLDLTADSDGFFSKLKKVLSTKLF